MYSVKNNATQHACFITLGFREAALNFRESFASEDDYPNVLASWGEGEAELIERFEAIGTLCADLFTGLADVIPSVPRGVYEYEVPQKLGGLLCGHIFQTGDFMPWRKMTDAIADLMIAYYENGLVPLDEMDTETVRDVVVKDTARAEREKITNLIRMRVKH